MTRPKRHLPQECVLITRRTHNREFLLAPNRHVVELVTYALALYSGQYGIKVHAAMVMSNHIHLVVTDTRGERSAFMRSFFALIARARNCQLERRDTFWSGQSVGDCVLLDPKTIMDKCVYTWANPVTACLTTKPESWAGFLVGTQHWGETRMVQRPEKFFKRSTLPDAVIFTPEPPPVPDLPPSEMMDSYKKALKEKVSHLLTTRRLILPTLRTGAYGKPFLKPKTREPWRKLNPEFAGHPRVRHDAVHEMALFRVAHRKGRESIRRGDIKAACMPPGTISLRSQAPWLVQRTPPCRVA